MKIFLIHGKNSNKNSFTLNNFVKILPNDIEKVFIEYDFTQEENKVHKQIRKQLEEAGITEDDVIVGHSLGGFWALLFSVIFNTRKILINPNLFPKDYTPLSWYVLRSLQRAGLCLTSSEDEVLEDNYRECREELEFIEVINMKTKHRVEDFSIYKEKIQELIGEYLW